ncbi:MAG: formyltetrahydrofolate deformylase [Spirochaetes bacterium]|nr:formyltetrahydrofolate deformylase [Spirochaetota bacterium]
MPTQILLVECDDRPGLVHRITGVLFERGCNVLVNSEFVDREAARFFMRTEYAGEASPRAVEASLRAVLPPEALLRFSEPRPRRIAVLCTREWHCLGDLLLRHAFGDLGAEIAVVLGNHPDLASLVERFEVPFLHVPDGGLSREAHEEAVGKALEPHRPEFLVLAKYMRVLTPGFLRIYPDRIVNIHHSFLPAFTGAHPYRQAFSRGVKIIGATAHLVTEILDEGPILAQDTIPVDHTWDAAAMARAGRDVERTVLARGLRLVFEDRVFLCGRRTVLFD